MKKIVFSIIIMFTFFSGCDKIEGPYLAESSAIDTDVDFPPLDTNAVFRKILLEEFTGHLGPNCPDGAQEVHNLCQRYGDTLVPIAVHAGFFSSVSSGLFSYNFQTEEGQTLASDFSVNSYPSAVIERTLYHNQMAMSTVSDWGAAISHLNRNDVPAAIQIISQYDAVTQNLSVHTLTTALQDYTSPVKLALYIIEDQIIAPQQVHSIVDTFYVHNHVLRKAINGAYGHFLTQSEEGDAGLLRTHTYPLSYRFDCQNTPWNIAHCQVVAILFDSETHEVLQVERKSLNNE